MRPGRDLPLHVLDPALEEGSDRHAGGINMGAVLALGQQPGALDLGLPLGAGKGMPAALALAGLRIAHVNNDGPMSGRPLAEMPLHFESSTISSRSGVSGPIVALSSRSRRAASPFISIRHVEFLFQATSPHWRLRTQLGRSHAPFVSSEGPS